MLSSIFRLLALKPRQPALSPVPSANKPLRMQMVYGSANPHLFQPNIQVTEKASSPAIVSSNRLDEQQKILEKESKYLIKKVTLPAGTSLIGLTRHTEVMLQSVFVSEPDAPYTDKWTLLKKQASEKKCGIAYLRTNQEIQCLKLLERDGGASGKPPVCGYLIDYRAISRDSTRGLLVYPESAKEISQNSFKK